jgi:hypothetical protein
LHQRKYCYEENVNTNKPVTATKKAPNAAVDSSVLAALESLAEPVGTFAGRKTWSYGSEMAESFPGTPGTQVEVKTDA